MDKDGVLVKTEQEGYGVVVKADASEHRVAGLSLEEQGGGGPAKVEAEQPERAGPGPIDNRALGEGRELREGMVRSFGGRCWRHGSYSWHRRRVSAVQRMAQVFRILLVVPRSRRWW